VVVGHDAEHHPSHQFGKFESEAKIVYLVAAERAPIASNTAVVQGRVREPDDERVGQVPDHVRRDVGRITAIAALTRASSSALTM